MGKCEEVKGLCLPNRRKWEEQEVESRQTLPLWGESTKTRGTKVQYLPHRVSVQLKALLLPDTEGLYSQYSVLSRENASRPQMHAPLDGGSLHTV